MLTFGVCFNICFAKIYFGSFQKTSVTPPQRKLEVNPLPPYDVLIHLQYCEREKKGEGLLEKGAYLRGGVNRQNTLEKTLRDYSLFIPQGGVGDSLCHIQKSYSPPSPHFGDLSIDNLPL